MKTILLIRRFLRGADGLAATEFALVLPLMVAGWLGMAQLAQQSQAAAKSTMAAESVADLASQMNPLAFSDLINAADQIMSPLPTSSLTIDMVDMLYGAASTPTQSWRCSSGGNLDNPVPLNLGVGLGNNGDSVIMVTVKYTYTPTITGGVLGSLSFVQRSFNKSRLGGAIAKPC